MGYRSLSGAQGVAAITTGTSKWSDGSASAPSIAWASSPTSGFYYAGANGTALAIGGGVAWTWTAGLAATMGAWQAASTYTLNVASGTDGNSNRAGMPLLLGGGQSTGNGAVGWVGAQVTPAGASGTSANSYITATVLHNTKSVTNNSATAIASFTLANNSVVAGIIRYAVEVTNGTDFQIEEGQISFHATNKAGVIANNVALKSANQQAMTAGTLTVTWTITAANPAVLTLNANSSLTPSTGYPRVTYDLSNLTQQAVALS